MTPEKVKKIKKYNARDFYLNKLKNLMKKLSEEQNINDKDKIEMKKYLNKIELTW